MTDEVIDKLSQLKLLKEEVEKRQRLSTSRQSQRLEEGLQQVQEQIRHLQPPYASRGMETGISRIWSQPSIATIKPPKLDIAPFKGEVLKWQEFRDAFEVSVDKVAYAPVDKFNYLKSKLKGEALEAISGYPGRLSQGGRRGACPPQLSQSLHRIIIFSIQIYS